MLSGVNASLFFEAFLVSKIYDFDTMSTAPIPVVLPEATHSDHESSLKSSSIDQEKVLEKKDVLTAQDEQYTAEDLAEQALIDEKKLVRKVRFLLLDLGLPVRLRYGIIPSNFRGHTFFFCLLTLLCLSSTD